MSCHVMPCLDVDVYKPGTKKNYYYYCHVHRLSSGLNGMTIGSIKNINNNQNRWVKDLTALQQNFTVPSDQKLPFGGYGHLRAEDRRGTTTQQQSNEARPTGRYKQRQRHSTQKKIQRQGVRKKEDEEKEDGEQGEAVIQRGRRILRRRLSIASLCRDKRTHKRAVRRDEKKRKERRREKTQRSTPVVSSLPSRRRKQHQQKRNQATTQGKEATPCINTTIVTKRITMIVGIGVGVGVGCLDLFAIDQSEQDKSSSLWVSVLWPPFLLPFSLPFLPSFFLLCFTTGIAHSCLFPFSFFFFPFSFSLCHATHHHG